MRIRTLKVKGFRSLADVVWDPGDLNLLIGPNAGGKSNLLRVIDMLSVSARGELGKYVQREGGMEPLLWDGSADRIETFVRLVEGGQASTNRGLGRIYELELTRLGRSSSYRIGKEQLGDFGDYPFRLLDRSSQRAVIFDREQNEYVASEESLTEGETLLSVAHGPFSKNDQTAETQRDISTWAVYQDLHTDRNGSIRLPAVSTIAKRVASDAQNLISVLHTLYTGDRDFEREVDDAMSVAFGDEYEKLIFPPDADQRIQLRVRWKSLKREQSAADLSDGTLRFLFLLAVLGNPNIPSVIAIDEPDIGLHPSMLPIVAEYASAASERAQVILTTHSPAFLDAFRESSPTITVVNSSKGRTQPEVLSGDKLAYWLKQYTLGELYNTGELEAMER